jgi:hypothetical protein
MQTRSPGGKRARPLFKPWVWGKARPRGVTLPTVRGSAKGRASATNSTRDRLATQRGRSRGRTKVTGVGPMLYAKGYFTAGVSVLALAVLVLLTMIIARNVAAPVPGAVEKLRAQKVAVDVMRQPLIRDE